MGEVGAYNVFNDNLCYNRYLIRRAITMKKLIMKLENCFGIKKMSLDIDYSYKNAAIIYAANGLMKTSLANTFERIRDGETVEERVHGKNSEYLIKDENNMNIENYNIIVINPFDESPCDNQGLLMANEKLRNNYLNIHEKIKNEKDNLYSRIKEQLKYDARKKFDVKTSMLDDWGKNPKNEFECLKLINSLIDDKDECPLEEDELDYELLFSDKVCSMLEKVETNQLIDSYEKKYNELIDNSPYMQHGIIDHNNYYKIGDALNENGFFEADNEIVLKEKDSSEQTTIGDSNELKELIEKEKERVLSDKEIKDIFEEISKLLEKNKDTKRFGNFLHNHKEVIPELNDIQSFKKKIWVKAYRSHADLLRELLKSYDEAKSSLDELREEAEKETTEWKKVLTLFKERFHVPFDIEASNQVDVILNNEMPSFKYIVKDKYGEKTVEKEKLLSFLSTGEKRAYYILNMIFKIEIAKKQEKECLLILDDISDSFDYKNKFAIIEYLSDIVNYRTDSDLETFKVLLLTHNFDFYRTVAARLNIRKNSFIAYRKKEEILFKKEQYTRNVFKFYKTRIKSKNEYDKIIASIPFVRNVIEYIEGSNNGEYLTLTSLLHYKDNTEEITLGNLQKIYNEYWFKTDKVFFAEGREDESVYRMIINEADSINDEERIDLENKIILSIAIRLKAELYMRERLLLEKENGNEEIGNLDYDYNQTIGLIKDYKRCINDDAINILDKVNLMTPENIHFNSFMYEPILDMSVKELFDLYQEIKNL